MNKVVYAFLTAEDIPFYIGMGSIDRCRNHKKGSRNWRWWKMMKINKDYKFVIVDRSLTEEQAYNIEIDLIAKFGRQGFDEKGILTNFSKGGAFYKSNPLNKQPIVQFTLEGIKVAEWPNYTAACEQFKPVKYNRGILGVCKGKAKSVQEHQWFFKKDVEGLDVVEPINRKRNSGGNTTSSSGWIHVETGEFFRGIRAALKWLGFTSGGGSQWLSVKNKFKKA